MEKESEIDAIATTGPTGNKERSGMDNESESGIEGFPVAVLSRADKRSMGKHDDTESDSSANMPTVKRRPYRRQRYREAWTEEFSPWLKKCEDNPFKGTCIACNKDIWAGRHDLVRHNNTLLHNSKMLQMDDTNGTEGDFLRTEIIRALGVIERGESFHSCDQLSQMRNFTSRDWHCSQSDSLKWSKMSAIMNNVVNKAYIEKDARFLTDKAFSVFIDESIDIVGLRYFCILARYVHEGKKETYLLDMLKVKGATADDLYQCFQCSLNKHGLSLQNVVGICYDNANHMLENENSLISTILKDNKEVAVFPCVSHTVELIACRARECLPSNLEDLLNLINEYPIRYPFAQGCVKLTQNGMRIAKESMPQQSQTKCPIFRSVSWVLLHWDELFNVFTEANIKDNSPTTSTIFELLCCPYTKAYLYFLDYVGHIFQHFTSLFESSKILIHRLVPECARFLRILAISFLNIDFSDIDDLCKTDIFDEKNLLPLEQMHIGDSAKTIIEEMRKKFSRSETIDNIQEFYRNCRKYYQCAFQETVRRIPWKESFLKSLDFLEPSVTLNLQKHENQLDGVLEKFKSKVDKARAKNEWFLMTGYFSESEKENLLKLDIIAFWESIGKMEDFSNRKLFANISKVANICLALPHWDAEIEEFFPLINEMKDTLCKVRLGLRNTNSNGLNYKIDNVILNYFKTVIYISFDKIMRKYALEDISRRGNTTKSAGD